MQMWEPVDGSRWDCKEGKIKEKLKNVDDLKVIYKDIQGKLSPSITHSQ